MEAIKINQAFVYLVFGIIIQFVTRPDVHSPDFRLEEKESYVFLQEQKLNMSMIILI